MPRLAEKTRWKNDASSPVVSEGVTRGCRMRVAGIHAMRLLHRRRGRLSGWRQLADEPGHRVARHARIGIERHDVDDIFGQRRVRRQEGRVVVAAQQAVQLVQFAALALPAHPAAFCARCRAGGGAGGGTAASLRMRITLVELGDLGPRKSSSSRSAASLLDLAVRPVRDQREGSVALAVGEVWTSRLRTLSSTSSREPISVGTTTRVRCLARHALLVLVADQPRRLA